MKLLLVSAALAAVVASPAFAHHGWSGQEAKITSLTGTVVQSVNLAGPHGGMKIKVGNQVWDITLAPPFRTSGSGLTEGKIPVGSTVTVRGNKTTEPGHYEMKTIYVKHGNEEYRVYPERDR